MIFRRATLLALLAASTNAFVCQPPSGSSALVLKSSLGTSTDAMDAAIRRQLNYQPGGADTDLAKRYGNLVGANIRTVGEAFAEFTKSLGHTVNPLYKSMVTDLVGTTHLISVNARFKRDAVWSLGLLTVMDLLLKNYPEKEVGKEIVTSLIESVGMNEADIRAEAETIKAWATGKSKADVEAALMGEGGSPLAAIATSIKSDKYFMYSRYFGIGLIKIQDLVGLEQDKDDVYAVMEDWMQEKLGLSPLTACADSDLFFKSKEKLDMMETMMKEIEIREKKRLAERLEEKAEFALLAAEKDQKLKDEIEADVASKTPETVA